MQFNGFFSSSDAAREDEVPDQGNNSSASSADEFVSVSSSVQAEAPVIASDGRSSASGSPGKLLDQLVSATIEGIRCGCLDALILCTKNNVTVFKPSPLLLF